MYGNTIRISHKNTHRLIDIIIVIWKLKNLKNIIPLKYSKH